MLRSHIISVLLLLSLSTASQAYSEFVIFGDSLSAGYSPWLKRDRRATDGKVWGEYLGERFNTRITNLAEIAASSTSVGFRQVDIYLDSFVNQNNYQPHEDALHIFFGGGADLINYATALQLQATPTTTPEQSANNIISGLNKLHSRGAADLMVFNMPNANFAPAFATIYPHLQPDVADWVQRFNQHLISEIDTLAFDVNIFDAFTAMNDVYDNKGLYGITNAIDPCPDFPNCDGYMWVDSIHFTTAVHGAMAEKLAATMVPVSPAGWLFGSALFGIAGISRGRR